MRIARTALILGLSGVLLSGTVRAQAPGNSGTIISLYPKGAVAPLGVAESRDRVGETGETMIFNVSDPTLELFRPAKGRGTVWPSSSHRAAASSV